MLNVHPASCMHHMRSRLSIRKHGCYQHRQQIARLPISTRSSAAQNNSPSSPSNDEPIIEEVTPDPRLSRRQMVNSVLVLPSLLDGLVSGLVAEEAAPVAGTCATCKLFVMLDDYFWSFL
jgi:hypothetical protein